MVTVKYCNKEYIYSNKRGLTTWRDERGLVVPVMLHTHLREMAISAGASSSVFLTQGVIQARGVREKEEDKDAVTVKSQVKKRKSKILKGGFNPFV